MAFSKRMVVALAAGLSLAACAKGSAAPKSAPDKAPPVNENPYPSTYKPYPGAPPAIRGATVFDGEGGRIDNGVVFLSDGKVTAIGGPDTAIPEGVTVI